MLRFPTLFVRGDSATKCGVLGVDLIDQPAGDLDASLAPYLRLALTLGDDVSGYGWTP
jgi:hypothetical protein